MTSVSNPTENRKWGMLQTPFSLQLDQWISKQ